MIFEYLYKELREKIGTLNTSPMYRTPNPSAKSSPRSSPQRLIKTLKSSILTKRLGAYSFKAPLRQTFPCRPQGYPKRSLSER